METEVRGKHISIKMAQSGYRLDHGYSVVVLLMQAKDLRLFSIDMDHYGWTIKCRTIMLF